MSLRLLPGLSRGFQSGSRSWCPERLARDTLASTPVSAPRMLKAFTIPPHSHKDFSQNYRILSSPFVPRGT
jgi:hypothetical protein